MDHLISKLALVAIGSVVLMAGILLFREAGKSFQSALKECMAWGVGFFVTMSVQILALGSL